MKGIIFVIFIIVIAAGYHFLRGRITNIDGGKVYINDISEIVSSLKNTGSNMSFAVILVPNTADADGYDASLQFSIENNELGFDWVLVAKRNINDLKRVRSLALSKGFRCSDRTENDVNYLRCIGPGKYADLAKVILLELYQVSENQELPLIVDGFKWRIKT